MSQPITNLSVGDKVKFGNYSVEVETAEPIEWIIASKNHNSKDPGYPVSAITLLTEKIIDLRAFDAKEANNPDTNRQSYGNNRYRDSNIRQWLNSIGATNAWWDATHTNDEPPTDALTNNYGTGYEDKDGFLNSFTTEELSKILDTSINAAVCDSPDGGGVDTVTDKVFLLSQVEVNGGTTEISASDGQILDIFEGATDVDRVAPVTQQVANYSNYDKTGDWYWFTRSARASRSNDVRYVNSAGSVSGDNAYVGNYGVRPALNLQSDLLVSDTTDADGAYTIIYNQSPTITVTEVNYPNISFTVDDSDGTIGSVKIFINEVEKHSYLDFEGVLSYVIDHNELSLGDNSLKIEVIDNESGKTIKEFNVNKAGIDSPAIGTNIIVGNKKYSITNVETDGTSLTLTIDRPLEKSVVVEEKIEVMTNFALPKVDFLDGEGFVNLEFKGKDIKDGYIQEEYILNKEGGKIKFKFEMAKESGKNFNFKEPKAIFGYGGE